MSAAGTVWAPPPRDAALRQALLEAFGPPSPSDASPTFSATPSSGAMSEGEEGGGGEEEGKEAGSAGGGEDGGVAVERHPIVEGLSVLRGFLSPRQQARLLQDVRAQGWAPPADEAALAPPPASGPPPVAARGCGEGGGGDDGSSGADAATAAVAGNVNQAMVFGFASFPPFLKRLARAAGRAATAHALLPPALSTREPPFQQVIVNAYSAGARLTPHVDLAAFADGIVGVSLLSDADFDFRRVSDADPSSCVCGPPAPGVAPWLPDASAGNAHGSEGGAACGGRHGPQEAGGGRVQGGGEGGEGYGVQTVRLHPGDLVVFHGPARYQWTHGIARHAAARVSLTLRCMREAVHLLVVEASEPGGDTY